MEKLPPREKIIEAWSALADGRVSVDGPLRTASVRSSNGDKTYTVSWNDDGTVYSSNDNATYWRGYAGYPVIAVLMEQGRVPYDAEMARRFEGVDWNAANKARRGEYAAAVADVVAHRGLDPEAVDAAVDPAYDALARLDIKVKRGKALAKSKE